MSTKFRAAIESVRNGGHAVVIPTKSAAGLSVHARVRGTLAGAPYRSSVMQRSGVFYLGVHKATLAAAGASAGDTVAITLELDDAPRATDEVPADLAAALAKNRAARSAFEALAPSHKREHVKYLLEAKQAATRERRIAKTLAMLVAKK